MFELGRAARAAAAVLAQTPSDVEARRARDGRARAAHGACGACSRPTREDVAEAKARGASSAMVDRLALDDKRIEATAAGLETVAALDDPVGRVVAEWQRPNGLEIARVRVPLGVIGIIYESRPNVTADAAALCLKSGNAAILRGGSESARSSAAIHACLARALARSTACPRRPCRWCRRRIAKPSASCCATWPASSTSSCRAAARVWSRACSRMRACRS